MSTAASDQSTPLSSILLIVSGCIFFSCLDTAAKWLVLRGYDPAFIVWCRFASHVVVMSILLRGWSNPEIFVARSWPKQIARAGALASVTLFNFLALQTLQLAETVSIFFFSPMVVTAVAGPLLGEKVGWRRWAAVATGMAGVLLILRPGAQEITIGHLYAFVAMLFYSVYVLMTRSLSGTEEPRSLLMISAIVPALVMLPVVPLSGTLPNNALDGLLLASLGLIGGIGHYLLVFAYRRATASGLAPYPYTQMIAMAALGYLVFGQLPDAYTVAGAAIIAMSGLYIAWREARRGAPVAMPVYLKR